MHGRLPLISLLARLGWQRDPAGWTIRCRDASGHRTVLCVGVFAEGVTVSASRPGLLHIAPLQVGRLRAALRDAVVSRAALHEPGVPTTRYDAAPPSNAREHDHAETCRPGAAA